MPRDWPRASLNCCCLMSSSWVMLYLASAGRELAAMSARSLLVWSRPWARSGAMDSGLVALKVAEACSTVALSWVRRVFHGPRWAAGA